MKKMKRMAALLLALCMAVGMLTACSEQDDTFTLRVCLPDAPTTLDPALITTESEKIVVNHLYENLMKLSGNAEGGYDVVYGVAGSYHYEDGLDGTQTYTFTLRDGVKWSDGRDVTAQDFVYAWQRLVDPATASPHAQILNMVAGYEAARSGDVTQLQVSAPDDYTLVVVLKQRCAYFLDQICTAAVTMPVRSDVVLQADWAVSAAGMTGNGAYHLTNWENDAITASAEETYYDAKRVGPDALEFRFTATAQEAMELYENGDVDFVLGLTDEAVAEQPEEWKADPYPQVDLLVVNQMAEGTVTEPLRQAMSLVLDRNAIAEALAARRCWAADGLIPYGIRNTSGEDFRTTAGALIDNVPENYESNCEKAKELIKDVKLPAAEQVTLLYENTSHHEKAAQMIRTMWKEKLGLEVKLISVTQEELIPALERGEFTVALTGMTYQLDDASAFLNSWTSGSAENRAHIYNTAYDLLMRISSDSASPVARDAYLKDAERMLLESGYVIPIHHGTTTWLLRDGLTGIFGNGMGLYYFTGVVEQPK